MNLLTRRSVYATAMLSLAMCTANAMAQRMSVTAGANMNIDFNEQIDVPYSGFVGAYFLDVDLIHDPSAGPMIKKFQSPITDTNDRILLDALQPAPQVIWEDFHLVELAGPPSASPVADWHEEILTDGWQWVLPGDTRFPGLFPEDASLITKNGEPYPWRTPILPAVYQPHKLWVEFAPIPPGNTLDVHKALLWVGTDGNRVWGDDALDDGTFFDETTIHVWEYPTIPEPSTCWLLAVGIVMSIAAARRRLSC